MKPNPPFDSLVILGPTASGKTKLAVSIASKYSGEVISIDSRMVYKRLNIGSGKDLHEYNDGINFVPYHLIDLVEPNIPYHIYQFQQDFKLAFKQVILNGKMPVLCGGSGLYLEAVIKDFTFTSVPNIPGFKEKLNDLTHDELVEKFNIYPYHPFKTIADLGSKKRSLRALEIIEFLNQNPEFSLPDSKPLNPFIIGIEPPIDERKVNIRKRLVQRIENGLLEEVQQLLKSGISAERLVSFGLEYKWVVNYLQNNSSKEELISGLSTAIIQFAKRQMTYFRKMEKSGLTIHWFKTTEDAFDFFCQHHPEIVLQLD